MQDVGAVPCGMASARQRRGRRCRPLSHGRSPRARSRRPGRV